MIQNSHENRELCSGALLYELLRDGNEKFLRFLTSLVYNLSIGLTTK